MNLKSLFYKNMRITMYFVGVGYILEVVLSVLSNCISSNNNFFEDQNHRAPVISFFKIEAPIQKILILTKQKVSANQNPSLSMHLNRAEQKIIK